MARPNSGHSEGRLALLGLISAMAVLLFASRDAAVERRTSPTLTDDIQAPIAAFFGRPLRAVEASLASAEDRARALEENRELRKELAELRAESQRLGAMRLRLQRLEAMLGIERRGEIPADRITARVVSDPDGPFVRSYLLGTGRDAGVRDGYAVMSDAGLVGHVVSAGSRSARVLRLDDLNSRVAVMNPRNGARAILIGANDGTSALRFVTGEASFVIEDRIVTSGDDGRLPQGLPIGTMKTADDRFLVTLDFTKRPVDWVVVLPTTPVADADDVERDAVQADGAIADTTGADTTNADGANADGAGQ